MFIFRKLQKSKKQPTTKYSINISNGAFKKSFLKIKKVPTLG